MSLSGICILQRISLVRELLPFEDQYALGTRSVPETSVRISGPSRDLACPGIASLRDSIRIRHRIRLERLGWAFMKPALMIFPIRIAANQDQSSKWDFGPPKSALGVSILLLDFHHQGIASLADRSRMGISSPGRISILSVHPILESSLKPELLPAVNPIRKRGLILKRVSALPGDCSFW